MPLDEDDVREILRLIDDSDGEELRVETEAFTLTVIREAEARAARIRGGSAERSRRRSSGRSTALRRPERRRSSTSARASRRKRSSA